MGKGDKKSRKGKIAIGSFGNSRRRNAIKAKRKRTASRKSTAEPASAEAPVKAKKVARKKTEAEQK
jgi:ribosomal small subunit protein bTHX